MVVHLVGGCCFVSHIGLAVSPLHACITRLDARRVKLEQDERAALASKSVPAARDTEGDLVLTTHSEAVSGDEGGGEDETEAAPLDTDDVPPDNAPVARPVASAGVGAGGSAGVASLDAPAAASLDAPAAGWEANTVEELQQRVRHLTDDAAARLQLQAEARLGWEQERDGLQSRVRALERELESCRSRTQAAEDALQARVEEVGTLQQELDTSRVALERDRQRLEERRAELQRNTDALRKQQEALRAQCEEVCAGCW